MTTYRFDVTFIPEGYSEPDSRVVYIEAYSFDQACDQVAEDTYRVGEPLEIRYVPSREVVFSNRRYLD